MINWIIGPQFVGLLFLAIGFLQKTYPPKKINALYGYRMPSVQNSQPKWNEAQRYSGKIMMKLGLVYILAGFIIAVFMYQFHCLNLNSAIILTIFAAVSAAILRIVFTEKHLSTVFKE